MWEDSYERWLAEFLNQALDLHDVKSGFLLSWCRYGCGLFVTLREVTAISKVVLLSQTWHAPLWLDREAPAPALGLAHGLDTSTVLSMIYSRLPPLVSGVKQGSVRQDAKMGELLCGFDVNTGLVSAS